MKIRVILSAVILLLNIQLNAQRDTVFVDISDSTLVYNSLPSGYNIIDTVENVANRLYFITAYHGMSTHPNSRWSGLHVGDKLDTLQNMFVHWSFKSSHGISNGVLYFRKDSVILDSLELTNDSVPVSHADTFPSGPFDSLQYKDHANGLDTVQFTMGYFQIRTEIRIALTTKLNEVSTKEEQPFLFPNPSQSTIYFKHFDGIQSEPYKILNVAGQTMMSGLINGDQIDISELKTGFYLFTVPNKQVALKFQKQ